MFSQDDDNRGLVLALVLGLAAGVIGLAIGVAMNQKNRSAQPVTAFAASPRPTPVSAVALLAPGALLESADLDTGGTSVIVQNGVVKFYFAPNESALAPGGRDALTQIVTAIAGGKKAVVSGFHDSTGDATRNAELARQRALAVRNALNALGVSNAQIELKKPEQMQTSGSNADARRVEIAVQ